ncbi:hypothetical protein GEMRC1_008897 [Eukaryota sp. GEM-RC1]
MTNKQQFEKLIQSFKPTGKASDLCADSDLYSTYTRLNRSDYTFEELGVSEDLLRAVKDDLRFINPTEIQAELISNVMDDPPTSCIVQSQSGTGKTLACALCSLMKVDRSISVPQILVLTSSPQNSHGIFKLFTTLVKHTEPAIYICPLYREPRADSVHNKENIVTSPRHAHVIIGTCCDIQQFIQNKELSLETITVFVMDEADQLLNEDKTLDHIHQLLPDSCQRLLFSATYPEAHHNYYFEIANKPTRRPKIIMKKDDLPHSCILQTALNTCSEDGTINLLVNLMKNYFSIGQAIIFVSTTDQAIKLHSDLTKWFGLKCGLLTGEVENRDEVITAFTGEQLQVLIATDGLHREIDMRHVAFVINYDLPFNQDGSVDFATYLHRIGTKWFGRGRIVINLTHDEEGNSQSHSQSAVLSIRDHYQIPLPWISMHEPDQLQQLVDLITSTMMDQRHQGSLQGPATIISTWASVVIPCLRVLQYKRFATFIIGLVTCHSIIMNSTIKNDDDTFPAVFAPQQSSGKNNDSPLIDSIFSIGSSTRLKAQFDNVFPAETRPSYQNVKIEHIPDFVLPDVKTFFCGDPLTDFTKFRALNDAINNIYKQWTLVTENKGAEILNDLDTIEDYIKTKAYAIAHKAYYRLFDERRERTLKMETWLQEVINDLRAKYPELTDLIEDRTFLLDYKK